MDEASPPPSDDDSERRIVDYLRRNAPTYNLNVLRRQLLAQGEPPELVDRAVARVRAEQPQREGVVRPALPWTIGALVLAAIASGVIALQDAGFADFGWVIWLLLFTAIAAGLGLVMLVAGAIVMLANRRRQGLAILFGGVFSLAVAAILVALSLGVCLVLIAQY